MTSASFCCSCKARKLTAFVNDPDGWLQEDDRMMENHVEVALDRAWREFATGGGNTTFRKRETLVRLFGTDNR